MGDPGADKAVVGCLVRPLLRQGMISPFGRLLCNPVSNSSQQGIEFNGGMEHRRWECQPSSPKSGVIRPRQQGE